MSTEEIKISEIVNPVNAFDFPAKAILFLNSFQSNGKLWEENIVKNKLLPHMEELNKTKQKYIFLSPEETGKTKILPDERAAYYKLGIYFYYLLTGHYPFNKAEAKDYIYAHINETPTPVRELQPEISTELSAFIDKLLSKNPADRYQSIQGMVYDLEFIQDRRKGFQLGEKDIAGKIFFSDQIFGRKTQLADLIQSVNTNFHGIITVKGDPGIGKTVFLHTFAEYLGNRILYLYSKSDQLERNKPFSAFAPVLKGILQFILSKKEADYFRFTEELNRVLGKEGQFLSLVLPEFGIITEKNKTDLPPENIKPVLETTLQKLFRFIKKEKQVFLFIDDVQWADSASLNLIKSLAEISDLNFIISIAYRQNETDGHLSNLLHTLEEKKYIQSSIRLEALKEEDVSEWLSDLLKMPENVLLPLSHLLHWKSKGNPFFIKQIVLILLSENYLYFKNGKWNYNSDSIKKAPIPDDLALLLANKIKDLPENTAKLLKTASIFGSTFSNNSLFKIFQTDNNNSEHLMLAENENLIVPIANSVEDNWMFSHDTIREFLYKQLDEDEKTELHFLAGKMIQENQGSLFKITDHFNQALRKFKKEKVVLAELNYKAGLNAKSSAAFELALFYFNTASEIISKDLATVDKSFSYKVLIEKAEAEYLNGRYKEMESICLNISEKADDIELLVKVNELLMLAHIAQGRMREAVDLGIDTLKKLGLEIPVSADEQRIGMAFEKVGKAMENKSISDLRTNSVMSDWKQIAAVRIIMYSGSAAYFVAQDIYPILVCEQTYLSITSGNSPYASDAYTTYGLLLAAFLGDIQSGYEFGQLGLAIKDDFNAINLSSKVSTMFNGFVRHWKEPIKNSIEPLKEGYLSGLETGDIEYACYNLTFLFIHQLFTDQSYATAIKEQHDWTRLMQKFNNKQTIEMSTPWTLMAKRLSGTQYVAKENEDLLIRLEKGENAIALCYAYIAEMVQQFYFANYDKVIEIGEKVPALLEQVVGIFVVPTWHFYLALAYLEIERNNDADPHEEKLRGWSQSCPENSLHRAMLIQAASKKDCSTFKAAIQKAEVSGILLEAGLANEIFGNFLLKSNKPIEATGHLLRASNFYRRIHALKKAELIEEQIKTITGAFDFVSTEENELLKELSNTLVSKLRIEELIEEILDIVTKNSAATRVLLITGKDSPQVYAEKIRTGKAIIHKTPLNEFPNAPLNLIRLTFYTGSITNWAGESDSHNREDYFINNKIKSAVAIPLIIENHTEAVLILENEISKVAFETSSITLFKTLSAPMGISIKNALLYEELQEKEALIKKSLEEKEDLLHALEKQKKSKVASVFEAEERERQRLAAELHDNIGQQLSAVKLNLEYIKGKESHLNDLEKITKLVDSISSDIRDLSHNMLPKALKEVGLVEALSDLIQKSFSGTGIKYEFEIFNLENVKISYNLSLALYRACQELISNAIKHANADIVNIQFAKNKNHLILFVEDNGSGISKSNKGIGLSNIKTRIEVYNGEFSICENKPKGTLATIKIPFV